MKPPSKFNEFCDLLLEKKKKTHVQGEKRDRWRKFLKKAGLNPDYWVYDVEEGEADLIKPTKD